MTQEFKDIVNNLTS